MKNLSAAIFIILLNSCCSLRPVSGTITDKNSGNPILGAKVYNKAKTYETTISDSTGHFYFLCVRSLFAITPLKIVIEKELYKPEYVKYRNIEAKEIRLEYKYKVAYNENDCPADSIDGQKVLTSADKMPSFKNGEASLNKYIYENLSFLNLTIKDPQSKVTVSLTIDTFGKVKNECISKSYIKGTITPIEQELLRVLREMPDWKPGEQNGKKVPVRMTIPLRICYR